MKQSVISGGGVEELQPEKELRRQAEAELHEEQVREKMDELKAAKGRHEPRYFETN